MFPQMHNLANSRLLSKRPAIKYGTGLGRSWIPYNHDHTNRGKLLIFRNRQEQTEALEPSHCQEEGTSATSSVSRAMKQARSSITNNPWILQTIQGCRLEFTQPPPFNSPIPETYLPSQQHQEKSGNGMESQWFYSRTLLREKTL